MSSVDIDRSGPPGPGDIRPYSFPPIHRLTLSNGLPMIFAQTSGLPVATLSLLVPSGATRETADRAGLAKLTASLLESGTEAMDAVAVSERLESMGVRLDSGTSWEISHVDFTALVEHLPGAAELMSSLMSEPSFPPAEVERLRHEQLAAILQRRAEPRGFATELASHFLFADHSPFSRPLGGTTGSVSQLGREEIVDFHRGTYTPRSGALVLAGKLDVEEARAAAEAAFGEWTGPEPPQPNLVVAPRFEERRVVVVDRPGAVQSEIRLGHIGVARDTPDYFAILVMNAILGGQFSSRLNLNLRERHGFTYGVRSNFVMRRWPGPFLVSTAVQTEVTAPAVREILVEVERIREAPVTPEELADARQYLAGTFPLLLQTTDGIANRLAELLIYGLPDSYLEDFATRVLAVGADEVERAARERLQPERALVVVLGDAARVRGDLEALGLGPVDVVDPATLP